MNFLSKYPRTKRLMEETGMSIEQAFIWTECEVEKLRKKKAETGG